MGGGQFQFSVTVEAVFQLPVPFSSEKGALVRCQAQVISLGLFCVPKGVYLLSTIIKKMTSPL